MLNGVEIDEEGNLSKVKFDKKRKNILYNNKVLNILHTTDDVAILSTHKFDSLCENNYFNFELPPPLSRYVYPKPLFILKNTKNIYSSIDCEEFKTICEQYMQSIREISNQMVVYDVPLDIESDDEDDLIEEESDESHSDEGEFEEEEDWEVDDETPIPETPVT